MDKLKNIWKIEHEEKISASVEKLWELITSPSNLELFHPFCKKNKVITWPGAQLDRASAFKADGQRFESFRDH
tara:strand:+ start:1699 stop:1917 length:219 start_codon:yes stop_codon:yes gene_type:complete